MLLLLNDVYCLIPQDTATAWTITFFHELSHYLFQENPTHPKKLFAIVLCNLPIRVFDISLDLFFLYFSACGVYWETKKSYLQLPDKIPQPRILLQQPVQIVRHLGVLCINLRSGHVWNSRLAELIKNHQIEIHYSPAVPPSPSSLAPLPPVSMTSSHPRRISASSPWWRMPSARKTAPFLAFPVWECPPESNIVFQGESHPIFEKGRRYLFNKNAANRCSFSGDYVRGTLNGNELVNGMCDGLTGIFCTARS